MNDAPRWTIHGSGAVAAALREVALVVPTDRPIDLLAGPADAAENAIATAPAALASNATRVIPLEAAFEAIEATRAAIASGTAGRVYGCFVSVRLPRGSSSQDVRDDALLSAVSLALDIVPGEPRRVWARRASLLAADDAWFVTIRCADDILLTIEALASEMPDSPRDILIEATGSERVLRAEPLRQAVVIERVGATPVRAPWTENLHERYLRLVLARADDPPGSGQRLRSTWRAIMRSSDSGHPVAPD